ncbi:TPA: mechanosensitive ion channel [Candidatus Woesearchaeota archaeon]|nr:mechanosensitive ion channel [Candidatus Woesearchaeota archaeon]
MGEMMKDAALRRERFKKALQEQFEQMRVLKRKVSNRSVLLFAAIFIIVELLVFGSETGWISLPIGIASSWHLIVVISLAFLVASILVHIANFILFKALKDEFEVEMRLFYSKFWGFVFYLAAGIFALNQLGFRQENITIFAGFIATGFALSMREVILSYIIWTILLFKHPFRIGDIIKIGDDEGLVEHIGTFYVKLSDGSGDPERCTRIPTKQFLEKPIQNYGTADFLEQFRITMPIDADAQDVLGKTIDIVRAESGSKENVMVNLEADALGAVRMVIVYYVVFEKRRAVRTKILAKVTALLAPKKKKNS